MSKYNIRVIETLERKVAVDAKTVEEAIADVQEQYDNEDIVLDYSDHVCTEIVSEYICTVVLTDVKDGTVILYHLQKEPADVESWLTEHYKNFDSNCSYMITHEEIEHVYN